MFESPRGHIGLDSVEVPVTSALSGPGPAVVELFQAFILLLLGRALPQRPDPLDDPTEAGHAEEIPGVPVFVRRARAALTKLWRNIEGGAA